VVRRYDMNEHAIHGGGWIRRSLLVLTSSLALLAASGATSSMAAAPAFRGPCPTHQKDTCVLMCKLTQRPPYVVARIVVDVDDNVANHEANGWFECGAAAVPPTL
jgi:hypothetical protein